MEDEKNKNINFGLIRKLDEKNRLIIPASIVERKKFLDGQELYIQKYADKVCIFIKEPEDEYLTVIYKKGHGITFLEDSGLDDFFGEEVRILEFRGGFSIYPYRK